LRVIAVAIGRKGAEIWAKEPNLQPVHCKSDRLLGWVSSRNNSIMEISINKDGFAISSL
jgi:hypothetical protein